MEYLKNYIIIVVWYAAKVQTDILNHTQNVNLAAAQKYLRM